MSERILNQVKFLCRKIAKVEWSGVLFYSVEGSIQDPENMVLTIEDILPMNKGTQAYTEYSFDERVINYMMENETMEKGWKMGHIHSHNTMAVFFSGTDWSELEDNAPNHNFYLSLIVNNFMDFCAKICFIAESNESKNFTFYAKDGDGNKYAYKEEEYEVKEQKLIVYDCSITSPSHEISVEETFSERVTKIIDDAEKRAHIPVHGYVKPAGSSIYTPANGTPSNPQAGRWSEFDNDWEWEGAGPYPDKGEEWKEKQVKGKDEAAWEASQGKTGQELEDEIEHFAMFVLNTGNSLEEFTDIEDILEYYKKYHISANALCKGVLDKYPDLYEKYYKSDKDKGKPAHFVLVTELLIGEYEIEGRVSCNSDIAMMLAPLIEGLKSMLDKFKKYEPNTSK
jgi:hypothetical protein